jgi:hypothetical protein
MANVKMAQKKIENKSGSVNQQTKPSRFAQP